MDVYKKISLSLGLLVIVLVASTVLGVQGCISERRNGTGAQDEIDRLGNVIKELSGPIGTFADQYIKLNDIIKQFNENQLAVGKVFEDIAVIMGERSVNDRETNATLERLRTSLDGTPETARGIADEILGFVGDGEAPAPAEDNTAGAGGIN
tara:strand:- start:90 stop:545 length:456 start_codon:yes stop_codon:yes gene_type:complete